ncbi:MAG: response regulator transcription factor [Devosia sp.]
MHIDHTLSTQRPPHRTITIADDHPVFLAGLSDLLSTEASVQIVGEADTAATTVEMIAATVPDIAILDLSMPGDVIRAITEILGTATSTKILIYTAYCSTESAVRALEAGAVGFVLKTSPYEELLEAIEAVSSGKIFVSKRYAAAVFGALREHSRVAALYEAARLTVRELEIVAHLLEGCTNRQIAVRLSLSERTVKYYMTHIMLKMKARNRVEVVISARQHERSIRLAAGSGQ